MGHAKTAPEGFALYEANSTTITGPCVDLHDVYLIRQLNIGMELSATEVSLRDRRGREFHRVRTSTREPIHVNLDADQPALDRTIRQRRLVRLVDVREREARDNGSMRRFAPEEFQSAVAHLTDQIQAGDGRGPVYLADRYFSRTIGRDPDATDRTIATYSDILVTSSDRPLRVLCAFGLNHTRSTKPNPELPPWWQQLPVAWRRHIAVRAVYKKTTDGLYRPAFHDRYLVAPDHETLITNSINGWIEDGVTFINSNGGLFRAEAERLWDLPVGESPGWYVQELPLAGARP